MVVSAILSVVAGSVASASTNIGILSLRAKTAPKRVEKKMEKLDLSVVPEDEQELYKANETASITTKDAIKSTVIATAASAIVGSAVAVGTGILINALTGSDDDCDCECDCDEDEE